MGTVALSGPKAAYLLVIDVTQNLLRGRIMKLNSVSLRNLLLFLAAFLCLSGLRAAAQTKQDTVSASASQLPRVPARITQTIDETQRVTLKGNVHPLARPEFDRGLVSDATPMNRMLLLLQRSPEQETALRQLMDEQQSKNSPNFHKWLTPQEFGPRFGPADADIQTVTSWLASQGFHDIKVGAGRVVIEFSGNVGQVRHAFHTEIHHFLVNAEMRQANVSDPQIPAALTPVITSIVTLHNFPKKSMRHTAGTFTSTRNSRGMPQLTTTTGCGTTGAQPCYVIGPADFAKIYNIPSTLNGTGSKIAIVGFSNINIQDVRDFRTLFGLSANDPHIVLNGPDPGIAVEEGEADLDVEWSGAVAPNSQVDFVVSEDTLTVGGLELSSLYVVDNNTDDIMSLSFGNCEAFLGTENIFFNALWEQAAAQGITVTVSAGDAGSAGCDNFNTAATAALGLAVSGIASTPFNVAVGGTDFDDVGKQTTFWNSTNTAGTRESALGYIPETAWNDSCAATATSANLNTVCATANNIVAGSGGSSTCGIVSTSTGACVSGYPKPSWQTGTGVPADSVRDVPDVSLFASDGPQSSSFYPVCQADAVSGNSCSNTGSFSFLRVGGTSVSAPSFAGILALVEQSERARVPGSSGRQGNANFVLYKLAQTASNSCNSSSRTDPTMPPPAGCVFNDVTKGNNSVPCAGNSPNCSSTTAGANGVLFTTIGTTKTPAFTTTAGYDLATGLGTVNVGNLATAWGTAVGAFQGTTASLTINGTTTPGTIAHGSTVTAAVMVSPTSGTVKPTGDVSLLAPTSVNGSVSDGTLANGTVSIMTTFLPGGMYNVTAHYAGDGAFAPSDSNGVPVTVTKENSSLLAEMVTFDLLGNITNTNATTFPYGSGPTLRMDILNHTGTAANCQPLVTNGATAGCAFDATGSVTITDNGSALAGSPLAINSAGDAQDQTIQLTGGSHTLVATYSGDISYNGSPAVNLNISVTPAMTATAVAANPTSGVTTATPVTLTATISSQSNSATGPTGNVVFKDGTTTIGTVAVTPAGATPTAFASGTAVLNASFTTTGTHSLTTVYAGDGNYATSTSAAVNLTVASSGSFTVSYNPNPAVLSSATGASVMSTVTVTPTGGFTGMVTVVCPTGANLPPGVTCIAPAAINVTSGPATGTLTLSIAATSTMLTASATPADRHIYAAGMTPLQGGKGWWALSGGTGLAAILLLLVPRRKRYRAALGFGLVCLVSFSLGCGGYSSGGGGGGPVPTVTKISVPAPGRVASGSTFTFTATVTGGTPTDQVELFDNGVAIGTAVAVSGGTASLTSPALAVGTHSISAHYLGDATYTQASQSGALNVTVTGNTSVAITTNPAATPAAPALNVTIN